MQMRPIRFPALGLPILVTAAIQTAPRSGLVLLACLLALAGCQSGAPASPTGLPTPATTPSLPTAAPPATQVRPTGTPPTSPGPTATATAAPQATATPRSGWTQVTPAGQAPPARYDHSAVFDPLREQLVVFGGRDAEALGDTWIYELATQRWRAVAAAGPAARFGHGAAYDPTGR